MLFFCKNLQVALQKACKMEKHWRFQGEAQRSKDFQNGRFIPFSKRGITATIKRELKRRSVVESVIGHLKNEGRLGRNYLQGELGDRMNVMLVAAGYNFKRILRWLRDIFCLVLQKLIDSISLQIAHVPT